MFLSTRRTKALAWALFAGVIVTLVLYYYLMLPYYRSQISELHLSFQGLESALYDKTHGRNLRVLIVHGIGQHCTGYSDRLMRGTLEWVDAPVSPAIDEHLEKLRDRVQEEALAFVERYRIQGRLPESADKDLALHLGALAKGLAAGDIPLAHERKDPVDGELGLERQRESKAAKDLQLFVKYGFIDSACRRLPLPQSVELADFDSVSEDLARINTCSAISRFAHTEGDIDCDRLTLDFYDGSELMGLAKKQHRSAQGVTTAMSSDQPCSAEYPLRQGHAG